MTKDEFDELAEGEKVWFAPHYFAFPLAGYKRQGHDGYGVFVNFFGEGMAFFSPTETGAERFFEAVSKYEEGGDGGE